LYKVDLKIQKKTNIQSNSLSLLFLHLQRAQKPKKNLNDKLLSFAAYFYLMSQVKKQLNIQRHDSSADQSLRPHTAADKYLLSEFEELGKSPEQIAIYHDRFGFLSCSLHTQHSVFVFNQKSQLNALERNSELNKLTPPTYSDPISALETKLDLALMKIPKSLALFRLYLEHITHNSTDNCVVLASFMTRHFTPKILEIAEEYFEEVTQSRAVKKSRVLTMKGKKKLEQQNCIDTLEYKSKTYQQYWGVFSAKHIDYATQYFLEHIDLKSSDKLILDLASGNGVIGSEISQKLSNASIHLMDDSYLAMASAKLNISGENIHHHFNHSLDGFDSESFDLIATNPPFHFEYEINIQIPIGLFKACFRCLKPSGNLQLVANKHLNYKTHLNDIFTKVEVLAENDSFTVYKCSKLN